MEALLKYPGRNSVSIGYPWQVCLLKSTLERPQSEVAEQTGCGTRGKGTKKVSLMLISGKAQVCKIQIHVFNLIEDAPMNV